MKFFIIQTEFRESTYFIKTGEMMGLGSGTGCIRRSIKSLVVELSKSVCVVSSKVKKQGYYQLVFYI